MEEGTADGSCEYIKPPLIISSCPHWSSMEKLLMLVEGVVAKSYRVIFIGGPLFKDEIEATGAEFEPLPFVPIRLEDKLDPEGYVHWYWNGLAAVLNAVNVFGTTTHPPGYRILSILPITDRGFESTSTCDPVHH